MIKVDIKGPLLRLTTWVKIFNLFDFHKDSNVVSSKAWYPSYFINHFLKELSLSHKLKFTNSNIFATWIVLTFAIFNFIWSYRLYSLKHLRLTPLGCKNIGIRKSEFGAKHAPLNRRGRENLSYLTCYGFLTPIALIYALVREKQIYLVTYSKFKSFCFFLQ